LLERGLAIELTDEAKEFLIKKAANLDYGARPLRRAIEQRVEDPLSRGIACGTFEGKNTILIDVFKNDEGKVTRLDFKEKLLRGERPCFIAIEVKSVAMHSLSPRSILEVEDGEFPLHACTIGELT
jgi:hypothetical protein